MRQNENANSVIWKCQFYDPPGDTILPAINIGSLSTCSAAAFCPMSSSSFRPNGVATLAP